MSIVIVTGAIAPYTNRLYDSVGAALDGDLTVMTCSEIEPQRKWTFPAPEHYERLTLPGLRAHRSYTSHVYVNPSVLRELARRKPRAILLSGFSPTMMMAGAYAVARGIPLGIMTDGSTETDPGAHSRVHRWMRKTLIPRARFGIGASADSNRLLASYGLAPERCTVVPIVTAWDGPKRFNTFAERPFDLHFCGAIDEHRKGALFLTSVVEKLARNGRKVRIRISGDGPLRDEVARRLAAAGAEAHFDGYLAQHQLAEAYGSAKLFLFPSREEPWGLVANEAIQCGTPVIASTHTTSGRELVGPTGAGVVRKLEVDDWVREIERFLETPTLWNRFQANHHRAGERFSVPRATSAFLTALSGARDETGPPTTTRATPPIAVGN